MKSTKNIRKNTAGTLSPAEARAQLERLRKERIEKKRRRQRRRLFLAMVLVIGVLFAGAWQSLFARPILSTGEYFPDFAEGTGSPLRQEEESGEPETREEHEIDYGSGIRPKSEGERKSEDYYTILLLGLDIAGGGQTDTMMLASYDVTNQKATVMSIPRDTMVNVPWDVKKINSVYSYYEDDGRDGVAAVYREIAQLVGFQPDFKVVVEWDAVGKVVDAIGGVWFDNPYPMDYHDPKQDLVIEQEPGWRLFTGDDAMQLIRWRQNDNDSPYGYRKRNGGIGDAGRMKLQQDFLKAVIRQLLSIENVTNIGRISKVFRENVETDLTFQNVLWFARRAIMDGLNVEDVEFLTMPWSGATVWSRTYKQDLSYVVPQGRALLDIVNEKLSPFKEVFSLSDLDIMSVNADGSLRSSTGRVEDRRAATAPDRTGAKK